MVGYGVTALRLYCPVLGGPAPPPPPAIPSGGGGRGPPPPPSRDSKPANSLPPVSDERGNLLASIRAGTQLKKVSNDESARGPSPPAEVGGGLDGMAGALARALQQRNNVIQQSGMFIGVVCL